MPDKVVKVRLKKRARMRLRRICVDVGADHQEVIALALEALEREREIRYNLATLTTAAPSPIEE